jgi:superfamily II DNA or RNA helicase
MLNQKGLKTVFLSGESSDEERSEAIRRLESDPKELDYILTVDIFNEGIDIPRVNQVILLRPTQSAIVFVQQLGRGLRKIPQKEYLTVIDFIGNYQRNFLIPIALYGDSTYNKDTLRKLLSSGSNTIPGTSTINFDVITKERIFKAIDQANMSLLADLKKDYQLLRYQLGRIPMMQDFGDHGYRDPMLYVEKYKSYANFLPLVENSWVREDFGIVC